MKPEEKQLLLKDLCARLPYGVNIHIKYYDLQGDGELVSRDLKLTDGNICYCFNNGHWVDIKPYLRPLSSMTEEEENMLDSMCNGVEMVSRLSGLKMFDKAFDLLYSKHLDIHGLIEKGLALEAPKEMYKV